MRRDNITYFKTEAALHFGQFLRDHGLSEVEIDQYLSNYVQLGHLSWGGVQVHIRPEDVSEAQINDNMAKIVGARIPDSDFEAAFPNVYLNDIVESVGGSLSTTDSPLSADQGKLLVDLIAGSYPPKKGEFYRMPTNADWPTVLDRAASFLSATQVESLRAQATLVAAKISPQLLVPGALTGGASTWDNAFLPSPPWPPKAGFASTI